MLLVSVAVLVALVAGTTVLVRRRRQGRRRSDAQVARAKAMDDGDLLAVRSALSCLDRIRADLQTVLADGPLGAARLAALGLAGRLDRLDALLKNQLLQRAGLVQEHARWVLRSPYPGDQPDQPDQVDNAADRASWQQLREAIGRGATQQAAAHAALESVRELSAELQRRELELAGKVFTGRG